MPTIIKESHIKTYQLDETRGSWEALFNALQAGALRYISRDRAYVFVNKRIHSEKGFLSDGLEGFARTLLGFTFYAYHKKDDNSAEYGRLKRWMELYKEGITNGVNPNYRYFWGRIKTSQVIVECSAIALSLLINRENMWDSLTQKSRSNLISLLKSNCGIKIPDNNWVWFRILHLLSLELLNGDNHRAEIEESLKKVSAMYYSDGWYLDGIPKKGFLCLDYYNAYAMHFYALIFAWLQDGRYAGYAEDIKEKARFFFNSYKEFFSPGTHPPLFGRSMIYRFACVAPWPLGILMKCCDVPVANVKNLLKDTVNAYLKRGITGKDNTLHFGAYGQQPLAGERYSGGSSPYWSFKAFSALLLPENHVFWKIREEKPKEEAGAYTAAKGSICILRADKSHVILINSNIRHGRYGLKYNKFAYSNMFPLNLDYKFPVDNMFLTKRRQLNRWSYQSKIVKSSSEKGHNACAWHAYPDSDISVETIIYPTASGYIIRHKLLSPDRVWFALGGFTIGDEEDNECSRSKDSIIVKGKGGFSALVMLQSGDIIFNIHKSNYGIACKRTLVPYARGCFDGRRGKELVFAAAAGKDLDELDNVISGAQRLYGKHAHAHL